MPAGPMPLALPGVAGPPGEAGLPAGLGQTVLACRLTHPVTPGTAPSLPAQPALGDAGGETWLPIAHLTSLPCPTFTPPLLLPTPLPAFICAPSHLSQPGYTMPALAGWDLALCALGSPTPPRSL